jgi:3-dehydroquinate synthetase
MVFAARLSVQLGTFTTAGETRLRRLLESAGLPVTLQSNPRRIRAMLEAMKLDKKVSDGQIRFVLADAIGRVRFGVPVPPSEVESVLLAARRRPPVVNPPSATPNEV